LPCFDQLGAEQVLAALRPLLTPTAQAQQSDTQQVVHDKDAG
jgi:hypothetical protein